MHYRLGECLSTLRALGYHRSSDLHAPIAKNRHVFLARLETAIGHWFEIFTPILIIAATHP
jgi:hypothetical protein